MEGSKTTIKTDHNVQKGRADVIRRRKFCRMEIDYQGALHTYFIPFICTRSIRDAILRFATSVSDYTGIENILWFMVIRKILNNSWTMSLILLHCIHWKYLWITLGHTGMVLKCTTSELSWEKRRYVLRTPGFTFPINGNKSCQHMSFIKSSFQQSMTHSLRYAVLLVVHHPPLTGY